MSGRKLIERPYVLTIKRISKEGWGNLLNSRYGDHGAGVFSEAKVI